MTTTAGEQVLGYARRLLAINDDAVAAVRGTRLACPVRLGVLADFAETWLPQVLARFARTHPTARLEVQVDRRIAMLDALDRGRLDLALVFDADRPRGVRLGDLPMGPSLVVLHRELLGESLLMMGLPPLKKKLIVIDAPLPRKRR